MRKLLPMAVAAVLGLFPAHARGVTTEDFQIQSAQDVIDLCTVAEGDPMHAAAVSFCHGYLVGAVQFYFASVAGPKARPTVCLPEPRPPRVQAIAEFVAWLRAHPEYLGDKPPDALMKFLTSMWPCRS